MARKIRSDAKAGVRPQARLRPYGRTQVQDRTNSPQGCEDRHAPETLEVSRVEPAFAADGGSAAEFFVMKKTDGVDPIRRRLA
jgi:hypothetical protein